MRTLVALLVWSIAVLASGCALAHERAEGGVTPPGRDAGAVLPTDGGPPRDAPSGAIAVTITSSAATQCQCHHGCGAGLDAEFGVLVQNSTPTEQRLEVIDIVFSPIDVPSPIYRASVRGTVQFAGGGLDGRWSAPTGDTTTTLVASLDLLTVTPGTYAIDVILLVAGRQQTITLDPLLIERANGC